MTLAAWLFAVSSMISRNYYGEQGIVYMFGKKSVLPYKLVFLLMAITGALADFSTGWMLWAHMLIVLTMGRLAVKDLDDYFKRLKGGAFQPRRQPRMIDVVGGKGAE